MTRELAHRASDGIEVWLRWNPRNDHLTVVVEDRVAETALELEARPDNALDVFNHPYVYAPQSVVEVATVGS